MRHDEVNRMLFAGIASLAQSIRRMYAEEEEIVYEDEIENSINGDISVDSIVLERSTDDEDTG